MSADVPSGTLDDFAQMWAWFATHCHDTSPLYERISLVVAGDRDLLERLRAAPPSAHLPPALLGLLDSGQKDAFNAAIAQAPAGADPKAAQTFAFRAKPYGMTDPFDLFTEVRKYQVRDVADRITTPLLITDPDNEQFFPGQPRQLYDLLPGEKEIIEFTQAQGANFHCQPTGRQLTHTQMLDWLADHLPSQQA